MRSFVPRLPSLVIAIGLGYFLFVQAHSAWANYWLRTDSQQAIATLIKKHWSGHGRFVYRYVVNGREYIGASSRNWQDARYSGVQPGDESPVYFSVSHPSISLLYKPQAVVEGLPVLIIVMFLEFFAVMAVIEPRSKWAFDFSDRMRTDDRIA
ncbi:MAG: hypothetical protein ACJ8KU_05165 [Chthoniobacterales bacterium]